MKRTVFALALLVSAPAFSLDRYVPPPAPQILKGTPIKVEQEIAWGYHVIHMERPPTDERKYLGDYVISLTRDGEVLPFYADLASRLYGRDQEIVFLKIPDGSDSQFTLKVVSRAQYPWREVFNGPVSSIPVIADQGPGK